jgi:hypothetical protein
MNVGFVACLDGLMFKDPEAPRTPSRLLTGTRLGAEARPIKFHLFTTFGLADYRSLTTTRSMYM